MDINKQLENEIRRLYADLKWKDEWVIKLYKEREKEYLEVIDSAKKLRNILTKINTQNLEKYYLMKLSDSCIDFDSRLKSAKLEDDNEEDYFYNS